MTNRPLPVSGKPGTREFLCAFTVSKCCDATVLRVCTAGQKCEYRCTKCGTQNHHNIKKEQDPQ